MSIVFWDYETGGLDRHHPNIQLAAVAVDDNFNELEAYEAKIQFDVRDAEPKALEIVNYMPEAWVDAKPERQVMREFLALLERHRTERRISPRTGNEYFVARLAGHNVVAFDKPRLEDMWRRHFPGKFFPADHRCLDTLQRIIWWAFERRMNVKSFTLGASLELLGIQAQGPLHDALWDCRASIAIAKYMAEESRQREIA